MRGAKARASGHAGVKLQPVDENDNPSQALLVMKDLPMDVLIDDGVFYQLPRPALSITNSTVQVRSPIMPAACTGMAAWIFTSCCHLQEYRRAVLRSRAPTSAYSLYVRVDCEGSVLTWAMLRGLTLMSEMLVNVKGTQR